MEIDTVSKTEGQPNSVHVWNASKSQRNNKLIAHCPTGDPQPKGRSRSERSSGAKTIRWGEIPTLPRLARGRLKPELTIQSDRSGKGPPFSGHCSTSPATPFPFCPLLTSTSPPSHLGPFKMVLTYIIWFNFLRFSFQSKH